MKYMLVCLIGVLGVFMIFLSTGASLDLNPTSSLNQNSEQGSQVFYKAPKLCDSIDFAGERVPIDRFDIRERLDREVLSNSYFHSNTFLLIKRANRYFPVIEPILKEHNIPEDFKYLAMIESGFIPTIVSPAGAAGIWQFMKPTAIEYGLEVSKEVDERYHLVKATHAACAYLNESFAKFGNWTMVAAAYNRGNSGMERAVEKQKCENYYDLLLNDETKRYLFRILALKMIAGNPQNYGFLLESEDLYPSISVEQIEVKGAVEDFVEFAKSHKISYNMLKIFNPWLRDYQLTNADGKTYMIEIPKLENLSSQHVEQTAYDASWVI